MYNNIRSDAWPNTADYHIYHKWGRYPKTCASCATEQNRDRATAERDNDEFRDYDPFALIDAEP